MNPADPWSINYFDAPTPKVHAPAPAGPKTPRLIPEVHELFTVQRHALDVLHDIRDLEHFLGHDKNGKVTSAIARLERDAENTYRVIRTYLQTYANPNDTI